MEDKDILDVFNGETTPVKPKLTDKEILTGFDKTRPVNTKNSLFANYNSIPISHNTEGTFKLGNDNVFEANQRDDTDAQSFSKQLGLFTGNTISNILSGTVGGIGYLGTIFEDKKGDYSNAITDWADSVRNPFGEIKRENNDTFDLTDSAFWFNSGQSIVESAVQFGLIAESGGLLAGAAASKLGTLLKLGNTATKVIKGGIQALTSVELSYLEGAMSGASVYRDIYKNQFEKLIAKGLSTDEANEKAKEFASNGASSVVQLNTTIGSALNLTGIGSVFNREMNVAQKYFSQGLGKRLANESIEKYSARLVKQSPEFLNTLTKQNYGKLLSEMTQEGIEEVVTQLSENTGRTEGQNSKDVGYLDSFQSAYNNINSVLNSEGLLNFSLGAIGGLSQTVLLDRLVPSQRINELTNDGKLILDEEKTAKENKPVYKTKLVSPRTRDIYDNQIYHDNLKDALVNDMNTIDDIKTKLANTTDKVEKQELFRKLFNISSLDSICKGTGENLIADYEEILKQDNSTDLSEQFVKPLEDINKQMESNKQLLNDANTNEEDKIKIKEEQIELSKQSVELQKSITENEGKTQASQLGLSKDTKDNDYKLRATKAINHIKQLTEIHNKNKEKYNQPEETNVNFAEYITKLQGDILGRREIQQDLENDFHKEKADFQMFSGIEEYAHIENILTNTELTSLYDERDKIKEAIKEYNKSKDVKVLEALVDGLDNKVYSENELSEKLTKKVNDITNGITEKEKDIEDRILNSESYKKSKFKTLDAYLKYYSGKNTQFHNLSSFNSTLLAYKRNTENMSKKLDEVTSNKGRSKFINNTEERIKLKKEQLEAEHNIHSFEEAVKMSDEIYYNNKIEKLNEEETNRIKREIENLEKEIKELEEEVVINKKKSFYSSFVEYFNKLSNKEMLVSLRKQRLNEIKEYLDKVQEVKEKVKEAVQKTDSKATKNIIVEEAKEVLNPTNNDNSLLSFNESDEDNSGDVMDLFGDIDIPNLAETPVDKQSALINELEQREKQIKEIIQKLNLFVIPLSGNSKVIVSDFIESSVYNKSFDANLLYKLLEQYYSNKTELKKLVLDLHKETSELIQFDVAIQNSINSQIAEMKKLLDDDYALQLLQQEQNSPVPFNPNFVEESNEGAVEESQEEEYSIPFTLNMIRSQQGDTDKFGKLTTDMVTNYNLPIDSEVYIQIEPSTDNENRVAFFLSGSNTIIGYLPTNEFINTNGKYNKQKDEDGNYFDNTKYYYAQEDTGVSNIEYEVIEVVKEMENFNFTQAEKDSVISYFDSEFGTDKEINYTNYNRLRISKIRSMFDNNPNLSLKSKVTDKKEGRVISDKVVKDLEISKNNDTRVRIHLNSQQTLYPAVTNASSKNFVGKSLAYISFPTVTGTSKTFPLILKKLQKEKINSIISLVNMYYEDKAQLESLYNQLGFNSTYKTEGEKFSDFLQTYFTTINYAKTDNKGNSITYYEKGNEFVFGKVKINALNLIKKSTSTFGSNVVNKVSKVLEQKLFTLDKTILAKEFAYNKTFKYPVLENGKVVVKSSKDYYEYIEKNIQTYAIINTENRDKDGKIIYVKDFVVNFDSSFYEKEMNKHKPNQNQQQEPDRKKEIDYGVSDVLKDDSEDKNNSNNSNNTFDDDDGFSPFSLSLERKPDYSYMEEYRNSNEEHKKFIGDVIFHNILNNSELKNKQDYLNQFKEITNLDDAVSLFHKICK